MPIRTVFAQSGVAKPLFFLFVLGSAKPKTKSSLAMPDYN